MDRIESKKQFNESPGSFITVSFLLLQYIEHKREWGGWEGRIYDFIVAALFMLAVCHKQTIGFT